MTINGEARAELDFSAMHPTLAYNIAGAQMEGDPYDLGELWWPAFDRNEFEIKLLYLLI